MTKWHAENKPNKALAKERSAAWYAANAELVKKRSAAWKAENPERAREIRRTWEEKNPDKIRAKRIAEVTRLPDHYVAKRLGLGMSQIPRELIELKRVQLQITRKLKELKHDNNDRYPKRPDQSL